MRKILASALTAAFMMGFAVPAWAAEGPEIRKVDLEGFPKVELTVSASTETLDPSDVIVSEGGVAQTAVEIEGIASAGTTVDVVLVIDTSGSMRGAPMAEAISAARRFVGQLPSEVRVGVVSFADRPRRVLGLTTDHAAARSALDELAATGETALYDGLAQAAGMFRGNAQRNIVLLSDGGDTASTTGFRNAMSAVTEADATVFSVGIRTPETDYSVLRRAARESGGRYSAVAAADLSGIYSGLAQTLGNQFVVSYTSGFESGGQIGIEVTTPTGSDSVIALAPRIEAAPAAEVPKSSDPILAGTTGMLVAVGLVFLAFFVLAFMLLGPRIEAARDRRLARMVGARLRASEEKKDAPAREGMARFIPTQLVHLGERWASGSAESSKIDRRLERAGFAMRAGEFVAGSFMVMTAAFLAGLLLTQNPLLAILLAAVGALVPHLLVSRAISKREEKIAAVLPDVLMVLSSSLRSGHSFLQALDQAADEVPDPAASEFTRVVAEVRLGRPVEEALNAMADRIESEDFKWAILAINIQREVGGNIAEVLDTVAKTLREREQVRRQVKVLAAEGVLSMRILVGLPILLFGYMFVVSREYLDTMLTSGAGLAALAAGGALLVIGIVWMRKLVKIDV